MSGNSSPSHSTDTSLSLSPGLLPEKNAVNELKTTEQHSSISEHISSINSLENDRSLLEIEISNIPDLNTILADNASPPISINLSNHLSNSAGKNVKSVLEEILHNEQFKSERSDRLDSNDDVSLNIFDGVNLDLDDSSINNYVLKLKSQDPDGFSYQDDAKLRSLEEALSVKDSIIQALNVEVESLKDLASNPSTLSMNTTLTEYKMFQEECATKFVHFENAIAHRDSIIARLKDSLITAQKQEDEMRAECEQYSKDIQCVQKELAEAVEYIKKCKCKCLEEKTNDENIVRSFSDSEALDLEVIYGQLEERLGDNKILPEIKRSISDYFQVQLGNKDLNHRSEIVKLQEKHVKEMDDTRKFYEEKCADFVGSKSSKVISNELISSTSRKLSDDEQNESDDDIDLYDVEYASKLYADDKSNLNAQKVRMFKSKIDAASRELNKFDLDNLRDDALFSLKHTIDNFHFVAVSAEELEGHYQAEIARLQTQLAEFQQGDVEKDDIDVETNLKVTSGEQEIDSIVQDYQTRLAEQVELAKVDIMLALEDNISKLAASDCEDSDWPKEFLEIRCKLSAKYEKQLADLNAKHEQEITHLTVILNQPRILSRAESREEVGDGDGVGISKERQTTNTLRNLLTDSFQYFAQCENELNTSLFEELLKNYQDSDSEINFSTSSSSKSEPSLTKRLHLAPNIHEFIAKIDTHNGSVSLEFKNELRVCLDRLKSEANAILELTTLRHDGNIQQQAITAKGEDSLNDKIQSLTTQVANDVKEKEELNKQLEEAKLLVNSLEIERNQLDQQMEDVIAKNRITEEELARARDKIGELIEYGRKEIVSEGYGENILHGGALRKPLSELNDRARQIIAENKTDGKALQIIEELTRECEQLVEDAKRERQDFTLQIESADKKLKSTQKFLEEQAVEREQERDEASKMINALREQLKDRQKDRAGYERVNEVTEMDTGTSSGTRESDGQFVQIVKIVEGFEQQMHEMSQLMADGERRFQEVNTEREEAIEKIGLLRDIIKDLEKQIKAKETLEEELKFLLEKQREANDDLLQQLEAASNTSNFQSHIIQLEEEVSKLRRASDIVGNEGLIKQIQLQLHELELSVDKSIREIESLYASRSATTCSTPSEEMSVQDQIRPKTPNSTVDDCEVPLQQLARLKEKLLKHSRAENSAIKRIQDMELQLLHAKQEQDELHNEKEVLQEQVSEQLVLISSLQMRLDDQRIRAEHVQKQANASLEMRIYDLENDLQTLRDKLQSRESTIKQLNKVIDETKQRLKDREDELSSTLEESEICDLRAEIERLKTDNELLRQKIESDVQNAQILPSLVDNIIADKNKDIESLRLKLEDTERQFEMFRSSSAADRTDDGHAPGGLSYFNVSSPEGMRSAAGSMLSMNMTKFVPEISSIEKVGPPNVNYTTDASLMKPNSTEIQKTVEKHVHFEEDSIPTPVIPAEIDALTHELQQVKEKLAEAENTVSELRVDLAEAKMRLTERETEINALHEDAKRKDDMYMQLTKEKREIERQFETLDTIRVSIEDLQKNEEELKHLLRETREKYAEKEKGYLKLQGEFTTLQIQKEEEIIHTVEENKTRYELLAKDYEQLSKELEQTHEKYHKELTEVKRLLEDRECELEILNEDVTRYQNEIHALEDQINAKPKENLQNVVQKKELAEKELEIVKLKSTISNLKRETSGILDQLIAKEEIIETMKVDSEALRINLETIKAKMNETGNIHDLRQKLNREREINAQLHAENEAASMEDVADQVRQQLNDSAALDDKIFIALSSGDFNNFSDSDALEHNLKKEHRNKLHLTERIKQLETQLHESQDTIKQLQDSVDDQKKLFDHVQVEDMNMMAQIRAKLEEAMETEREYEAQLAKETALRSQLEEEVTMLRRTSNTVSTGSTTDYISLGNLQEQRFVREIKQLQEELANLKREIKNLRKVRNVTECELKCNKEMLKLKETEVLKLEKRIDERDADARKVLEELRHVKHELDMKTWEADKEKSSVASLEQQKLQLSLKLSLLESKQQPAQANSTVPDVFLQKMKDLGELVTEHINENKLMADTIAKLTSERNQLEGKIRLLEDKDRLQLPFDDPVARANHLFGKYLRADSHRHALSFQKKYLIGLLATYQDVIGHPLGKFEPKRSHVKRTGKSRFRAVAVMFIAIFRMKYMVQRWHSGSRSYTYMSLQRRLRGDTHGMHFQVGKPVSEDHFRIGIANPRSNLGSNLSAIRQNIGTNPAGASTSAIPWSGMSPPSKDGQHREKTTHAPAPETFEHLRPPAVDLDTYLERFNLIQQRLGSTLNHFNS